MPRVLGGRGQKGAGLVEVRTDLPAQEGTAGASSAARSSDWPAYERLVLSCEESVFRLAYLIVRDPDLATERAVRSFLACRAAFEGPGDPLNFRSRLLRQVFEDVSAERRAAQVRARGAGAHGPSRLMPDVAVVRGDQNRLILSGIARLDADERKLLYLHYFLALDSREAAEILGCAEPQVQLRLEGALSSLRSTFERRPRQRPDAARAPWAIEQAVQATAAAFPYPPTAAIAEVVRQRLESRRFAEVLPPAGARPTRQTSIATAHRAPWSLLACITVSVVLLVLVVLLALPRLR